MMSPLSSFLGIHQLPKINHKYVLAHLPNLYISGLVASTLQWKSPVECVLRLLVDCGDMKSILRRMVCFRSYICTCENELKGWQIGKFPSPKLGNHNAREIDRASHVVKPLIPPHLPVLRISNQLTESYSSCPHLCGVYAPHTR